MLTTRPRGTNDILPEQSVAWQALERVVRDLCRQFGFGEIRTPVFEHTELFDRAAGASTDVVRKEMYTFSDRGDRSVTLRPEGTAPVVRAYLEHGLASRSQPVKLYYLATPMFRYERPQAGRYRQHHQFGAEALGSLDPALDAEIISLPIELLRRLGVNIDQVGVRMNSIGCPRCRPAHREALRRYFEPHLSDMCRDCHERFELNPLRMLDCKRPTCRKLRPGAPRTIDYLCDECASHLSELRGCLDIMGITYELDATLVRGFDYYTKTVFEVVYSGLGAQDAVAGGGRYDGLIEEMGGPATPAIGFGLGMERLLLMLEHLGITLTRPAKTDVFIATVGDAVRPQAAGLVLNLRRHGLAADLDYGGRGLKAQMRLAGRYGAKYVVIVGEKELGKGTVAVRHMELGTQNEVPFGELTAHLIAALGGQPGADCAAGSDLRPTGHDEAGGDGR